MSGLIRILIWHGALAILLNVDVNILKPRRQVRPRQWRFDQCLADGLTAPWTSNTLMRTDREGIEG
ncbi:hypothetical protein DKQ62_00475 [Halomonas elongata]|nr:hypothetical protein DKQ62_00475 [Halomonas elongata]